MAGPRWLGPGFRAVGLLRALAVAARLTLRAARLPGAASRSTEALRVGIPGAPHGARLRLSNLSQSSHQQGYWFYLQNALTVCFFATSLI